MKKRKCFKRALNVLISLLIILTLVGCNSSQKGEPIIEEPEITELQEDDILGGYIDVVDGTLTDELKDIFNKALSGLLGASYEPIKLVATQVVAGTNYKFLANGTKTTNPITKGTYYITIYKDLQGNVSLLDIETIEEKQEEIIQEEDLTKHDYWVVFYDQYGNELQRTIEHYASVPSYKRDLPEGFDNWAYKNSGKDVIKFVPIITNTYFVAKCHEVNHNNSTSDPEYVQIDSLTSVPGAYINSKVTASNNMEFVFDAKMAKIEWCRCFGYWNSTNSGLAFQSASGAYGGDLMFYASDGTNTYQYAQSGVDITQKTTYDVKFGGTATDASYIKVNGNTVKTFTAGTVSTDKEITIFTLTDSGMASGADKKPNTIYYMKIYKEGSLVRDYIPVRTLKEIDKSKNAADPNSSIPADTLCFYDKVDKLYYPSSGPNTFSDNPDHLEVECLTRNGTSGPYINTLVQTSDNMRFVFDAKAKSGVWTFMFGAYMGYLNGISFHSYYNNSSQHGYEAYIGNHGNGPFVNQDAGLNEKSHYDFQVKSGDSFIIINGETEYSDTQSVSIATPQNLYMFAENNKNTGVDFGESLTIYYMQIYQNDVLVRDYIPVYTTSIIDKTRNATNPSVDIPMLTYCMYDKLNDKYYTNAGGGSFTCVPIS